MQLLEFPTWWQMILIYISFVHLLVLALKVSVFVNTRNQMIEQKVVLFVCVAFFLDVDRLSNHGLSDEILRHIVFSV